MSLKLVLQVRLYVKNCTLFELRKSIGLCFFGLTSFACCCAYDEVFRRAYDGLNVFDR